MNRTTASRPKVLPGYTSKFELEHGSLFLTVSEIDGQPFEVFATIGKAGTATHGLAEGLCRMISLHLRRGTPVSEIHDQLMNIKEFAPTWNQTASGSVQIYGVCDAIAHVLHRYLPVEDKA